jgi:hypothetical protein
MLHCHAHQTVKLLLTRDTSHNVAGQRSRQRYGTPHAGQRRLLAQSASKLGHDAVAGPPAAHNGDEFAS